MILYLISYKLKVKISKNSKIQTMIRADRGYPLISQHKGGDQIKCMKSQRLAGRP